MPDALPHDDFVAQDTSLTAEQRQMLLTEADRLQTLYLDARNGIQSVFNFYLTFVTAVIGGLIFILQGAEDGLTLANQLMLIGLLFFAALVGSVYMSALSGRYGHAARFAHALDAVRRALLQGIPLPDVYRNFTTAQVAAKRRKNPIIWLVPTGTFQMFIAIVNAAALGLAVWLLALMGGALREGVVAGLLIFFISLTIYNIYSRLVIQRFSRALDVRVDMTGVLGAWAARQ